MTDVFDTETAKLAEASKAWPFDEARKLLARLEKLPSRPETVLFETGYGPSGLPHIGTFGEVARTTMVRLCLPRADGGQMADAADLLFRRHGRPAARCPTIFRTGT